MGRTPVKSTIEASLSSSLSSSMSGLLLDRRLTECIMPRTNDSALFQELEVRQLLNRYPCGISKSPSTNAQCCSGSEKLRAMIFEITMSSGGGGDTPSASYCWVNAM